MLCLAPHPRALFPFCPICLTSCLCIRSFCPRRRQGFLVSSLPKLSIACQSSPAPFHSAPKARTTDPPSMAPTTSIASATNQAQPADLLALDSKVFAGAESLSREMQQNRSGQSVVKEELV